jgi:hypothetical protein
VAVKKPIARCQTCGGLLLGAWFALHAGPGRLRLCRDCVRDTLARADAEAARQETELEQMWQLPFSAIGTGEELQEN